MLIILLYYIWCPKQELTGKLARSTLLLQEFEFDIIHQPRVQHAVADYLSPLESGEEGTRVKNYFPDGHLFRVEMITVQEMNEELDYRNDNFPYDRVTTKASISRRKETISSSQPKFLPFKRHSLP